MTGNHVYFSELNKSVIGKVRFGDGPCVEIQGKGSIILEGIGGEQRVLTEVYFIPYLKCNIISLGQATEMGCKVIMEDDMMLLFDNARKIMMRVFRS